MFADSWASQRPPCKASCCTVWTIVRLPEWSFTRCEWPDLGVAHHELIPVARGIQYSSVQADTDPPVRWGGGGLSDFKHALFVYSKLFFLGGTSSTPGHCTTDKGINAQVLIVLCRWRSGSPIFFFFFSCKATKALLEQPCSVLFIKWTKPVMISSLCDCQLSQCLEGKSILGRGKTVCHTGV